MADHITLDVDEARAIVDKWLTKAYPRAWQREYVANGIADDLKAASNPSDLLIDMTQTLSETTQELRATTQKLGSTTQLLAEASDIIEVLNEELDDVLAADDYCPAAAADPLHDTEQAMSRGWR